MPVSMIRYNMRGYGASIACVCVNYCYSDGYTIDEGASAVKLYPPNMPSVDQASLRHHSMYRNTDPHATLHHNNNCYYHCTS